MQNKRFTKHNKIWLYERHTLFRFLSCLSFGGLWATPAYAIPFQAFEPRALAMGGAMVAVTDRYSAFANPAALALLHESQSVFISLPVLGQQKTRSNPLEKRLQDFQSSLPGPADDQLKTREALSGTRQASALYAGGGIGLPSLPISLGAALQGYYLETLEAYEQTPSQLNDSSRVRLKAVSVIETQISLAKTFNEGSGSNRLALGLVPKLMTLRSYTYDLPANNIDLDRAGKAKLDLSRFNFDLGLIKEFAYTWKAGLLLRNALPVSIDYASPSNESQAFKPQLRAGLSHRTPRALYAFDLDLSVNNAIGGESRSRLAALGIDYSVGEHWRLRTGLQANLLDLDGSRLSLGLGLDFKHFRLDSGLSANRSDYLAMFKFGMMF